MNSERARLDDMPKPSLPYPVPLLSFPLMVGNAAILKKRPLPPLSMMQEWLAVHGEGEFVGSVMPASVLIELYPEMVDYAFFELVRGTPALAQMQVFLDAVCAAVSVEWDEGFRYTMNLFNSWCSSQWSPPTYFWNEGGYKARSFAMEAKWAAEMCTPSGWWINIDAQVLMVSMFLASPYLESKEAREEFSAMEERMDELFTDLGLVELVGALRASI